MTALKSQEMWAVVLENGTIDSIHEKREWAGYCLQALKIHAPASGARIRRVRVEVVDE